MNLKQHLRERHLDLELHRPMLDEAEGVATFYLWNLSGQIVGYQQYRPFASKSFDNNPREGRYFTYRNRHYPTVGVWGLESFYLTPGVLFVVEGVFDAARLTELGVSAIAVLGNDPQADTRNWLMSLNRLIVVVADNDKAGRELAKFGHVAVFTEDHDLGDSSEEFVNSLIQKYVKRKQSV